MTSSSLKIIAIVTMLIDHVGAVFFPEHTIFRIIGRVSFPLFAFMLAEGFFHSKNVKKYALRLLLFALISEIPYDLLFYGEIINIKGQNIMFELLASLIALYCLERTKESSLWVLGTAAMLVLSEILYFSYGLYGVLLAICFYLFKDKKLLSVLALLLCTALYVIFMRGSSVQLFAVISGVFIYFYNGRRGAGLPRYFSYAFYPAHLLLLYFIFIYAPVIF